MKNADMNCVLEKAMVDFKDAYDRLLVTVRRYEQTKGVDVNDLKGFTESYPFDKSLDELDIDKWVTTVTEGLQSPKFTVVGYEYLNTGGNCMVGIHTVWLRDENKTVYVYTNEEGGTIAAVDYIRNELPIDDYDELMLDYVDWGRVTGHEKYFELYRRCLNDYTKDDCKHFGYTRCLPYLLLSDELQKQVDADYLVYCESEHGGLIDTDGSKVIVYPDYEATTADDKFIATVKEFKCWHDTIAGDEKYYDDKYKLMIGDKEIELPFMASAWTGVDTLLKTVIEEW